ncbi:hypothetical protein D3C76_1334440 [compost metagenome]
MAKLNQFSGGVNGPVLAYSLFVLNEAKNTTTIGTSATNAPKSRDAYLIRLPAAYFTLYMNYLSSLINNRCSNVTTITIMRRTTAIAEARPNLLYLNAVDTVWITNVLLPLEPPVIIYGISKALIAPLIASIRFN